MYIPYLTFAVVSKFDSNLSASNTENDNTELSLPELLHPESASCNNRTHPSQWARNHQYQSFGSIGSGKKERKYLRLVLLHLFPYLTH